uniref:Lactamase_B domain-containing protein n=1 Tax=Panagrellus redivivus TaxID=6233 RepID=A0A7E4UPI7_PANRE
MSHFCVHAIGSNAVRIFHPAAKKPTTQWKDIPSLDENSSLEDVIANAKQVFPVITRSIRTFVLVNPLHYPPAYVNAIVDLVRHTIVVHDVIVISSLHARLLYAFDRITVRKEKERILVVCAFDNCLDVALVVGGQVQDHVFTTSVSQINIALKQQQALTKATRIIILATKYNENVCMAAKKNLEGVVIVGVHPETAMYDGAFIRAMQPAPLVKDFCEGVVVDTLIGKKVQTKTLIPRGSQFPVSAHLALSDISAIKIRYVDTLIIHPSRKPFKTGEVFIHPKVICNACDIKMIIASFGTDIKLSVTDTSKLSKPAPSVTAKAPAPASVVKETPKKAVPKKSEPGSNEIKFIIKLRAGYGSIWMDLGDTVQPLTNPMNETWTCDYISINHPLIGPAGKLDARKNPKSTVYDLHKYVGVKYKKAKEDPAVKFNYVRFKLHPESDEGLDSTSVYDEGPGCLFELIMHGEPRLISPTTCLGLFLIALKRVASDKLGVAVERIAIHLNKGDYHVDQIPAVEEAAQIASLTVTDVQIVNIV